MTSRPLAQYEERRGVAYANLYTDGKIGAMDPDVFYIGRIRAENCVAMLRIREKRS